MSSRKANAGMARLFILASQKKETIAILLSGEDRIGPLVCQTGGGSIIHVEKDLCRAFVSLFAVEAVKTECRFAHWMLDVTTKTLIGWDA